MRSLAGYWHTGVGGGSRTEPRYLQKHGDLLEWEMSDAALFLRDSRIRTYVRSAATATRSGRR